MRRALRICSVSILTVIVTVLYIHSIELFDLSSRIYSIKDNPFQARKGETRRIIHTEGGLQSIRDWQPQKENRRQNEHKNNQEGQVLITRNNIEVVLSVDKELKGPIPSDRDRHPDMVQRKEIVQKEGRIFQRRHLNEVDTIEEKNFSPSEYPFNVNLSDIIYQYETKGYANEDPINMFNHRYIINPGEVCSGRDSIKVLFIVKSSPDHSVKRAVIRETWADRKRFPWLRVAFSFGVPNNATSLLDLQEESSKTNDILLVNYHDNYYNLTLKTISGLRWAVSNCARAAFVISVDDDIYVAPDLLLSFLDKLPARKAEKLYHGRLIVQTSPVRDQTGIFGKWVVSMDEYAFKTYPHYIFGGFVIMSMRTVRAFTIAAMYTKLLKFEDVYLGILAARVGIEPTDSGHVDAKKTVTASESFKTVIASHFYTDAYDLKMAWECHLSLISDNTPKSQACNTIGTRLHNLKREIDSMVSLLASIKRII
ncbi:beta-1,3-galactosyltransferase 1-like [Argopecten irradians]|uniref:beta-1,3-galactosyltransferase 1-like n=1 Tax=Argopecten irradians TaxID=31199 RepID=UPI00371809FA